MAIEALGSLAQDGNKEALDVLMDVVATQDRKSLRRPAAAAVVNAVPALRTRVEEALPESEHYALGLREASIAELTVAVDHRRREERKRRRPAGHSRPPKGEVA
jgi:hypothetical protein